MSFSAPPLPQLVETNTSTLLHTMARWAFVSKTKFQRSIERALAVAFSTTQHGQYLYVRRIWDQLWPDTATGRWLDRHAKIWGLVRKPAQRATGLVRVLGEDQAQIPAGLVVEWKGEGQFYEVVEAAQLVDGEAVVELVARAPGPASDAPAGASLRLTEAIAGVEPELAVIVGPQGEDGIVGGLDVEADEDLRERLLLRIAEPTKGGAPADYRLWALEVAGVTRSWCVPKYAGPGTVLILAVNDTADPITLGPDKLAELAAHLDIVAPATDHRLVSAPELLAIDHEIVLSPNTAAVQQSVVAALADHYRRRELGSTVRHSKVSEAISGAAGEDWHALVAPAIDIELAQYQIPALGAVSFIDP